MKNLHVVLSFFLCLIFFDDTSAEILKVEVFKKEMIHFNPDSTNKYSSANINLLDNGREIETTVSIPGIAHNKKITGYLSIHPIPKDHLSVNDPWDRAGNITLKKDGMAAIELIKFITAYGGQTNYQVDLSHLAPILKNEIAISGFIDTWVSPGWEVDFYLEFENLKDSIAPIWNHGLINIPSFNSDNYGKDGIEVEVTIPENLKRVQLYYFVSGHCTDGRDADEFISKDNVINIDGNIIYRFQPWRDDCRQFREINPYTKRWSDGYWSSDYSRSGWCPGDMVKPMILDVSDHLKPGKHTVKFMIENIRPKDENGNYGYWRVSSYLVGWDKWDIYKYNE